jgi:TRAP transporter TAXI family solute receptor
VKLFSACRAAILVAVFLVAPLSSRAAPPPGWPASLTIATASPGGVFVIYGQAMAQIFTEALGIPVSAQVTQGSGQNILMIEGGNAQLALVSTDVALDGWNGEGAWTRNKKLRSLRALFPMYDAPLVLVTLKTSGINSWPDAAGKRIAGGPPGSAAQIVAKAFDALGIQATWRNGAYDVLSKQLQAGVVDALVSTIAAPAPALTELDQTGEIQFVPLSAGEIAKLCAAMAQFSPSVVPGGTYPTMKSDYMTVGWFNFVVASKDLPDDLVYAIVKSFYANHARMVQAHASARESVVANLKRNTFIPYHPGAARYYKEIGIAIPANLAKPD